ITELTVTADLIGHAQAIAHCILPCLAVVITDAFNQGGRKLPAFSQHGADYGVIRADDSGLGEMQWHIVRRAVIQCLTELRRHELGKHHFAEIMQQSGDIAVTGSTSPASWWLANARAIEA